MPKKKSTRAEQLEQLRLESERALDELIRRWQTLPPNRRTNFLRKRIGFRASCL